MVTTFVDKRLEPKGLCHDLNVFLTIWIKAVWGCEERGRREQRTEQAPLLWLLVMPALCAGRG